MKDKIVFVGEKKPDKIVFVGEKSACDPIRLLQPANMLNGHGYECIYTDVHNAYHKIENYVDRKNMMIVFGRTCNPELIQLYNAKGIPTVMDMDDDFHALPIHHVAYNHIGPGNPKYLKRLELSYNLVSAIITPSKILQGRLMEFNKDVRYFPNTWKLADSLWNMPIKRDPRFTFGWTGTITHREDFNLCENAIRRFVKAYPETRLFIGGDPKIYALFKSIPEQQKFFLPFLHYDLMPYIFSQLDVFLAPLKVDKFNLSKSDIKLVEAGAGKTAWLASPIDQYREWDTSASISFCSSEAEWFNSLESLYKAPDQLQAMKERAHDLSNTREIETQFDHWDSFFKEMTA